jgi:DNA-binding response OmpR family regulator
MGEIYTDQGLCALLLGKFEDDRRLVQEIFRRADWRLLEAPDRRRALECLGRDRVQVVIAEADLPRWNWKQVLRDLHRMALPPALVVTSRTADDSLWAEVLNLGGYDVLAQPFESSEVERVIASAGRQFWRRPAGIVLGSGGGQTYRAAH